jgi:hypothetical protein
MLKSSRFTVASLLASPRRKWKFNTWLLASAAPCGVAMPDAMSVAA